MPTKYYFINKFDTKYLDNQTTNTAIIYRNYSKKVDINLIIKIKKYCKKKKFKFFLSNNIRLAINLNLDGSYIPSFNRNTNHLSYAIKKNFLIIGSAHNIREIKTKELQNVKILFISSIFKKNKNYLGFNRFRQISNFTKKKIIALGGVSKKNEKILNLTRSFGFAGISYFE